MDSKELTEHIKEEATKIGFDLVGIASANDSQFDRAPQGHKPVEYLPGAKSVVVGGREVLDEILQTTPSPIYSKHYDQLNEWLLNAGDLLSRSLRRHGFKAMWFPETDNPGYFRQQIDQGDKVLIPSFSHISAATAAGLGVRGKVGVVLTPQFGPRQSWISVITTAPLIPDPKFEEELCWERVNPGSCGDRSIQVCSKSRSGALKPWPEEGGVNMLQCEWKNLKDKGLACGMCIMVCPVGK